MQCQYPNPNHTRTRSFFPIPEPDPSRSWKHLPVGPCSRTWPDSSWWESGWWMYDVSYNEVCIKTISKLRFVVNCISTDSSTRTPLCSWICCGWKRLTSTSSFSHVTPGAILQSLTTSAWWLKTSVSSMSMWRGDELYSSQGLAPGRPPSEPDRTASQ